MFANNFLRVARRLFRGISIQNGNVRFERPRNGDAILYDGFEPEEPNEDDCCHSGCQNCVFDVYMKELDRWKKRRKGIIFPNVRLDLLSPTKFKPFVLMDIKKVTLNTNLYTFKPAAGNINGTLQYAAGQYLSLRVGNNVSTNAEEDKINKSSHLIRDFTILSLSNEKNDCSFEVLIKLYEGSFTSEYIKSIGIGDTTFWRGAYGGFTYNPNTFSPLILFCIGTGFTPMYPIIREILNNEKDETIISLHFGCRNSSEIILRNEIEMFLKYWNFSCTYYLSEEISLNEKKYYEHFVLSRLNQEHVKEAISCYESAFILVCGSDLFNSEMKNLLEKLNIPECRYYIF